MMLSPPGGSEPPVGLASAQPRQLDDLVASSSPRRRRGRPGRESPSESASSATTEAFARPRSGAAVTRTFQASPWRPTTPRRFAPGETRIRTRVVRGSCP